MFPVFGFLVPFGLMIVIVDDGEKTAIGLLSFFLRERESAALMRHVDSSCCGERAAQCSLVHRPSVRPSVRGRPSAASVPVQCSARRQRGREIVANFAAVTIASRPTTIRPTIHPFLSFLPLPLLSPLPFRVCIRKRTHLAVAFLFRFSRKA